MRPLNPDARISAPGTNWGLDAPLTRVNEAKPTAICDSFAIGIARISASIPILDPRRQFITPSTDVTQ